MFKLKSPKGKNMGSDFPFTFSSSKTTAWKFVSKRVHGHAFISGWPEQYVSPFLFQGVFSSQAFWAAKPWLPCEAREEFWIMISAPNWLPPPFCSLFHWIPLVSFMLDFILYTILMANLDLSWGSLLCFSLLSVQSLVLWSKVYKARQKRDDTVTVGLSLQGLTRKHYSSSLCSSSILFKVKKY
jgi:hypothetical protein